MLSHGEEKMKTTGPAAKAVDSLIAESDPNSENSKSPCAPGENDSVQSACQGEGNDTES